MCQHLHSQPVCYGKTSSCEHVNENNLQTLVRRIIGHSSNHRAIPDPNNEPCSSILASQPLITYIPNKPGVHWIIYSSMKIELNSHTDARGSDTYNCDLSGRRAEPARQYLIKLGISADRITTKGLGESHIRNNCANAENCSKEDQQFNRRTEFRITYIDKQYKSEDKKFIPVNTYQKAPIVPQKRETLGFGN